MTQFLLRRKEAQLADSSAGGVGESISHAARLQAENAARAAASLAAAQRLLATGRPVTSAIQRVSRKVPYFG